MCGLAGIIGMSRERADAPAGRLLDSIRHRGPDHQAIEHISSPNGAASLVHARLSIIDMSAAANQPMHFEDRLWLTFVGEIYNYLEIRKELEAVGRSFRTQSDTEVLLQSYDEWGIGCVERFNGAFTFAIIDKSKNRVFLVRDRLGIKPLYYTYKRKRFLVFASEATAVANSGVIDRSPNMKVIGDFLRLGFVSETETIYDQVQSLEPGAYLESDLSANKISLKRYWSFSCQRKSKTSLKEILSDSVKLRLRADVPTAVFLSAGLDSTVLSILASKQQSKVDTITVGFPGFEGVDESQLANRTARELGTQHHEVGVSAQELVPDFCDYLKSMDQPTVDGFNTFFITKRAHRLGFRVVLSGVGSDELFGGYPSFRQIPLALRWMRLARLAGVGSLISQVPTRWALKLTDSLKQKFGLNQLYLMRRAVYTPSQMTEMGFEPSLGSLTMENAWEPGELEEFKQIARLELCSYMKDMLLRDSDVFSFRNQVELRAPFLDHRVVDAALSLPQEQLKKKPGKSALIQAMAGEVPSYVVNRKKTGFVFPLENWYRGELNALVEERIHGFSDWKSLGLDPFGVFKTHQRFIEEDPRIATTQITALLALSQKFQR